MDDQRISSHHKPAILDIHPKIQVDRSVCGGTSSGSTRIDQSSQLVFLQKVIDADICFCGWFGVRSASVVQHGVDIFGIHFRRRISTES
jgi:hypothetical protein